MGPGFGFVRVRMWGISQGRGRWKGSSVRSSSSGRTSEDGSHWTFGTENEDSLESGISSLPTLSCDRRIRLCGIDVMFCLCSSDMILCLWDRELFLNLNCLRKMVQLCSLKHADVTELYRYRYLNGLLHKV